MRTKVFILLIISSLFLKAQEKNLVLDFMPYDYPYIVYDYQTYSGDLSKVFFAPSMQQSVRLSASLVNSTYYLLGKINLDNLTPSPFVNGIAYSLLYTGAYIFLEYIPGGVSWVHEEYHRAVLNVNNVSSYDEVYDFKFLASIIRVNNVEDTALILFKKNNPQSFVRLHSAGIEGENMLIFELFKRNFYYNQNFSYGVIAASSVLNSFSYIYSCQTAYAEQTTDEENAKDGTNIKVRDFTGLDFTAWVYDLYNPFEPYEARGIHPSGVGIDRYLKPSDLTQKQLKLLKREAYLHLLNFVSPFYLGFKRIKVSENFEFNFMVRHLLNAFGHNIDLIFMAKHKNLNFLAGLDFYKNKFLTLPGVDFSIYDYDLKIKNLNLYNSLRIKAWLQPENLLYFDTEFSPGYLAEYKLSFRKGIFEPYFITSYKTRGYVEGDEFLRQNFRFMFGFALNLK